MDEGRPRRAVEPILQQILRIAPEDHAARLFAHRHLAEQFRAHSVDRAYLALVRGRPRAVSGTIARPIGRDPRDRKRFAVVESGKHVTLPHEATLRGVDRNNNS